MSCKVVKTEILKQENITVMCKAMRSGGLDVVRDAGTAIAKSGGTEVFRSMKGPMQYWITRRANGLFNEDGISQEDALAVFRRIRAAGGIQNVKGLETVGEGALT